MWLPCSHQYEYVYVPMLYSSLVCAVASVRLLAANMTDESGMSDDEPDEWRTTGRVKKPRSLSSKLSDSVKRTVKRGAFARNHYLVHFIPSDEVQLILIGWSPLFETTIKFQVKLFSRREHSGLGQELFMTGKAPPPPQKKKKTALKEGVSC